MLSEENLGVRAANLHEHPQQILRLARASSLFVFIQHTRFCRFRVRKVSLSKIRWGRSLAMNVLSLDRWVAVDMHVIVAVGKSSRQNALRGEFSMIDLTQMLGFSATLKSHVPRVYGPALPVRPHQRRCGK
jgi:hypothetical protein